jgi:hypothetical protein
MRYASFCFGADGNEKLHKLRSLLLVQFLDGIIRLTRCEVIELQNTYFDNTVSYSIVKVRIYALCFVLLLFVLYPYDES